MTERECHYCGKPKDLRPYGPKGEGVCFSCAMEPERKATTETMFGRTLDACGDVAVLDDNGLRPANAVDIATVRAASEMEIGS